MNSKNSTAKNIPTAILLDWMYNGIMSLLRACHNVVKSLAHTASTRCSPRTIFSLNPCSFTFLPSAPSSTISLFTLSCVPTASYVFLFMMKKLPKKYPVFLEGSFTRSAENLVCKNVDKTGNVIFVHQSRQSIFGMTVRESSSSLRRWSTDREIVLCVWVVSASVN